jgi:hypothetical protein
LHGGPDGQLDGFELVLHTGHPRLVIDLLARQAPSDGRCAALAVAVTIRSRS